MRYCCCGCKDLSKYHKCSTLEFAEKKCGEYPDDDGYRAALALLKQEAGNQRQACGTSANGFFTPSILAD
jgi:hypothetical protein